MARPGSRFPTELELQILQIIWRGGPATARDVRDTLAGLENGRDLAHTSVVTVLNIMVKKRYLRRTKRGKAYVFRPSVAERDVAGGMLRDVLNRVFDGSPEAMMVSLLETDDIDDREMAKLHRLTGRKREESSE